MRLCPKCGQKNEDIRCPHDGTATLVLTANPESRLVEGTEINGRYRIRKMIGQGGFGAVYRATNIATDQDIAIKLLSVSLDSDDSDQIQRFFAEAQVTASLKHPNTIRVFDFGQTEGGALYIAMELLSGRPLNEILKRRLAEGRVMTEDETITIGTQVLRSLAEAHLAQLVHRDLKPHNVFLHEVEGDDPVVKVLDFGIAKRLGSNLTGTGKAFGTPSYMSPEQAQNQQIDHRSDLYSLACVLYQCVSGKSPFEGDDPLAVLLAHVTKTAADLRVTAQTPVSEAFVRVLEKAMAKDPAERYATAIEFRQALDQARGRNRTETARSVLPSAAELAAPEQSAARVTGQTVGYGSPEDPRAPQHARGSGATPARPTSASPDERTASFASPAAASAATGRKPMPAPPRSASSTRVPAADDVDGGDEAPLPPKSNKKTLIVGAAIAAALGVVAVLAFEPKPLPPPEAPAPATVAQAPQPAAPVPEPPKPTPPTPEPPKPEPTPTPPKPAPGPVAVSIDSDPPGASVLVGGQPVGKTPATVNVPADGKVTAVVTLAGHRDLELELTAADAPHKLAKLTPSAGTPVRTGPGGKKSGGGSSSGGSGGGKKGGVDLDERLP